MPGTVFVSPTLPLYCETVCSGNDIEKYLYVLCLAMLFNIYIEWHIDQIDWM